MSLLSTTATITAITITPALAGDQEAVITTGALLQERTFRLTDFVGIL